MSSKPSLTLEIVSPPSQSTPLTRSLTVVSKARFGNSAGPQSKDISKDAIDDEEYAEDYGYLSDSDLEDDEDEKTASSKHTRKSKVHLFDPFVVPSGDRIIPYEGHEEHIENGKIIKIPDMAFVT